MHDIKAAYKSLFEEIDENIRRRIRDDLEDFLSNNRQEMTNDQLKMVRRTLDNIAEQPEDEIVKSLINLASYFPYDALANEVSRIMSILVNKERQDKLKENKMQSSTTLAYKDAYREMVEEACAKKHVDEDMVAPIGGMSAAPGGALGDGSLGVGDARVPVIIGVTKRGIAGKCGCDKKGKKRCKKCGQVLTKHKKMIKDCLGAKYKVKELEESDDSYNFELTECEKMEESVVADKPNGKLNVICGWCKKNMGTKDTSKKADDGKPSHGICPECYKKVEKQLADLRASGALKKKK